MTSTRGCGYVLVKRSRERGGTEDRAPEGHERGAQQYLHQWQQQLVRFFSQQLFTKLYLASLLQYCSKSIKTLGEAIGTDRAYSVPAGPQLTGRGLLPPPQNSTPL